MQRILIVDDSITHSRFIEDTLGDMGYILEFAADGEDALSKCSSCNYDLIIMDIVMPRKNGFQLCRELRSHFSYKNTPIIVVSSKKLDSERFWGFKQGADEYLTKPCNPLELLEAVTRLLSDRQLYGAHCN
jgi:twitching motility two-component system response regulator PilH